MVEISSLGAILELKHRFAGSIPGTSAILNLDSVLNEVHPASSGLLGSYLIWLKIVFFCICFDGVVIAAQCTATFEALLCFPEFRYY